MNKLIMFCMTAAFSVNALAVSIVSDPYPVTGVQPTHCRLMFTAPTGQADRTTPVETLADSTVRCNWAIDDLLTAGQSISLTVTAAAIDQSTGQESPATSPFSLSASGSPSIPAALQLEY